MSQNDLVIANQSFPSFRTDLNSALQAINTSHSGTSRPSGAVAGTIWLDTTGTPTANTLKFFDGTDDISLASINYTANTVDWLDSTVSITGLSTTATGTVLTLSDSSLTSSVNLILQNQKEIRFSETTANGVNYVGFKAPASLSADKIWILPSADGTAGQFLKTDGAGNLSFDSLSFSTPLAVIGNATSGSEIRLPEDTDNGSNYVAIKAPDTIASNLTLTLPSADGTSGQVLQTNGSGVLSFSSVGSDFVKLLSTSASASSAVSIDGYFTSTYDKYVLYLNGGYMSTANRLNMKVNKSGTAQTGSYDCVGEYQSTQPSDGYVTDTDYFHLGYFGTSTTRRNDAIIEIYNPLGTSYAKAFTWTTNGQDGGYALWTAGAGVHNVTSAISGITILNQSGYNFTIDKITLYGVK